MVLSVIVAIADNGVIGGGNELLWHIPDDLKRFKRVTSGHSVIMGRKTFESIGKPLPNRRNIVVTRNLEFFVVGVEVASSLATALEMTKNEAEAFVIGGGEIYRQALPMASKLYITRVHAEYKGDTYFPEIDPKKWQLVYSEKGNPTISPNYTFEEYIRIRG